MRTHRDPLPPHSFDILNFPAYYSSSVEMPDTQKKGCWQWDKNRWPLSEERWRGGFMFIVYLCMCVCVWMPLPMCVVLGFPLCWFMSIVITWILAALRWRLYRNKKSLWLSEFRVGGMGWIPKRQNMLFFFATPKLHYGFCLWTPKTSTTINILYIRIEMTYNSWYSKL